jgi:predicted acylesterase/phospholipase RssA
VRSLDVIGVLSPKVRSGHAHPELRTSRLKTLLLMCIVWPFALSGCAGLGARELRPSVDQQPPPGLPTVIRTLDANRHFSQVSATVAAERLRAQHPGEPLNILALSGGGAASAFGAGAVAGLTRSGARPEFAVVTGVSAGGFIAPYAFLGPSWDSSLIEAFTDTSAAHLLQSRGLAIVFGSSLYSGRPLKRLVDTYASDAMIAAVAREADQGRLLLVATTNVVTGEPVVWDLGSIAKYGGSSGKVLFRKILVASASVPGFFPPVVITIHDDAGSHEEAHVDGSTTGPFIVPAAFLESAPASRDDTPRTAVYVIIDGPLSEAAQATRLSARGIVTRSIHAGLDHMLLTTLELTAANTQQQGASLRYSAIPQSYPHVGLFDVRTATRQSLFHYAYDCAQSGRLWTPFTHIPNDAGKTSTPAQIQAVPCPADDASIRYLASR